MFETTRRHLYLAGFMGTGKSVIGKLVAERLGWGFIDLDEFIVSLTHRSVAEIFQSDGEAAFRQIESKALRLAVISPHSVIALGGGTPTMTTNTTTIRQTGRCWLLTATWDDIWQRVRANISTRPLLAGVAIDVGSEAEQFARFVSVVQPVLDKRRVSYENVADHVLDTSGRRVDELAKEIVEQFTLDTVGKSGHLRVVIC